MSMWHEFKTFFKERTLRKWYLQAGQWANLWGFSFVIDIGGPGHGGWCQPWAHGHGVCKKTDLSKPQSTIQQAALLHGLCVGSCLQFPALVQFLSRLPSASVMQNWSWDFPPQVALGLGVLSQQWNAKLGTFWFLCGPFWVAMMSCWTEPRISPEPQHSRLWPCQRPGASESKVPRSQGAASRAWHSLISFPHPTHNRAQKWSLTEVFISEGYILKNLNPLPFLPWL